MIKPFFKKNVEVCGNFLFRTGEDSPGPSKLPVEAFERGHVGRHEQGDGGFEPCRKCGGGAIAMKSENALVQGSEVGWSKSCHGFSQGSLVPQGLARLQGIMRGYLPDSDRVGRLVTKNKIA